MCECGALDSKECRERGMRSDAGWLFWTAYSAHLDEKLMNRQKWTVYDWNLVQNRGGTRIKLAKTAYLAYGLHRSRIKRLKTACCVPNAAVCGLEDSSNENGMGRERANRMPKRREGQ
jgi:hypothetical protein